MKRFFSLYDDEMTYGSGAVLDYSENWAHTWWGIAFYFKKNVNGPTSSLEHGRNTTGTITACPKGFKKQQRPPYCEKKLFLSYGGRPWEDGGGA